MYSLEIILAPKTDVALGVTIVPVLLVYIIQLFERVGSVTVTVQVAVFPPSLVLTVIVAVPEALAVTKPEEETVATEVLLEDQVTDLSVAFEGVIVAARV